MKIFDRQISREKMPRLIIITAACLTLVVFAVALCSTMIRIHNVRAEISEYDVAIAQKKSELEQLDQKVRYNESDEFREDAARDNGFVREDETVFIVTN